MKAALVGNQNSGKTTIFNLLTGSNVKTGNFPGVTVNVNVGKIKNTDDCEIADLPGIYSLSGMSEDERCAIRFLTSQNPELIINVLDGTCLGRGLCLTTRLMDMKIPMIIVVNMMDEVKERGGKIDFSSLSECLGLPVIGVSASDEASFERLIGAIKKGGALGSISWYSADRRISECIGDIKEMIGGAELRSYPAEYIAQLLVEGSTPRDVKLPEGILSGIKARIKRFETRMNDSGAGALASARFAYIDRVCKKSVDIPASEGDKKSADIDRILTGKAAHFIFFGIMFICFILTFDILSPALIKILESVVRAVYKITANALDFLSVSPVLKIIVCDGIISGVGSVLSFLPVILIFFFFLSLIEDTGYSARIAFIFDSAMRKIGLSGKCLVPLITGGGCSVPAVMSTRTLTSGRERALTIFLIPYVSCSAKIPVYAVFAAAFFRVHSIFAVAALYLFGIITGIISTALIKKITNIRESDIFYLEEPPYRMPALRNILSLMKRRSKDFLSKAFSVIFIASLIICIVNSLTPSLEAAHSHEESILYQIGKYIAPVFEPLGFGSVPFAVSIICGISAKEAIISTLAISLGTSAGALSDVLPSALSVPSALSFLSFVVLGVPCIATIAALRRETKSLFRTLIYVLSWFAVAYVVSFFVYRTTLLICG